MENNQKKLYRIKDGKILCGVCGGLAEYLNLDISVVRLLAVVLGCCSLGTAVVAYIVCAVVVPERPDGEIPGEFTDKGDDTTK